ncbi:MAG: exosortase U [Planctomycetota bacterium]|nr:exosortase U [Planctomycetota bacterium]
MCVALSSTYLKQDLTFGTGYLFLYGFCFLATVLAAWLASVVLHGTFESVEQKSTDFRPVFGLINAVFSWPAAPPTQLPADIEDREVLEAQILQQKQALEALPRSFWFESRIPNLSIRICSIVILTLGLLPTIVLIQGGVRPAFADRIISAETATMLDEFVLPPQLDEASIRPIDRNGPAGGSKSWAIQKGQRSLTLSLKHSFQGWHDPTTELVQRGWTPMLKLRIEQFGNRNWGIFGASLQTDLGAFVYIFNSMLNEQLEAVDVVPNFQGGSFAFETAYQRKTIFDLLRGDVRSTDNTSVQLMLVVNSGEQLLEPEINEIVQLYDSLRHELKQ